MTDIVQKSSQNDFLVKALRFGQLCGLHHMLQLRDFFTGIFRTAMLFVKVYDLIGNFAGLLGGHLQCV